VIGQNRGRFLSKKEQKQMFFCLIQIFYKEMTCFFSTKNMSIDELIDAILSMIYQKEEFASIRCPLRHLLAWTEFDPYKNKVFQAFIAQLREVQLHSINMTSINNGWEDQIVDTNCGFNGAWLLDPRHLTFVYKQPSFDMSLLTLIRRLNETLCMKLVVFKRGGKKHEEKKEDEFQLQQQRVLGIQSEASFLYKREFMRLICDGKRRVFRWFPNGLASMISLPSDLLYGEYTASFTKTNKVQIVFYGVPFQESSSSSLMRVCLTVDYLSESHQLLVDGVLERKEKESSSASSNVISSEVWQEVIVFQAKYNRILPSKRGEKKNINE
jgi:hypothetical protein